MRHSIGVFKPIKLHFSKHVGALITLSQYCGSAKVPKSRGKKLRINNSWNPLGTGSNRSQVATSGIKLGDKWPEYQGRNHWEGMLDPLDDNLRDEILRYGEFVDATYRSFEFDTSSPDYGMCRYSRFSMLAQCGLGESGYRVTRNLRATCGVQLPRWLDQAGPSWAFTRSGWIGYVAVCNDKEEIARLGRRDVVIALRGTITCLEWLENFRATLACPHDHVGPKNDGAMVESGFLSMYTSRTATCPSLQDMVREEIARVLRSYGDEPLSVTIVGHSLGAALATLAAYDITTTFDHAPMVTVISFAGPRVGNRSFRSQLEKSGAKILRIVNSDDVVTKVPGFVIDNNEVADGEAVQVAGLPSWLQERVDHKHWVYADVGRELRLSSRESPHLSNGNFATNIAACHDLRTYLHLVNSFVSSTCPLKATAKSVLESTHQEKQLLLFR
ncbi:hypothetical protein Vadar_010560 [Vaccinium darrowii]|uniref:Uncharacterized protein n=1 Tax=Vaccinium darrowii TaxID=229202 RepID=A0ACB7ZAN4_9ERIC|nr:hypothetical protein Vadar_010560 [Vaccinium darrowii]